jgi:hypothetical protein
VQHARRRQGLACHVGLRHRRPEDAQRPVTLDLLTQPPCPSTTSITVVNNRLSCAAGTSGEQAAARTVEPTMSANKAARQPARQTADPLHRSRSRDP